MISRRQQEDYWDRLREIYSIFTFGSRNDYRLARKIKRGEIGEGNVIREKDSFVWWYYVINGVHDDGVSVVSLMQSQGEAAMEKGFVELFDSEFQRQFFDFEYIAKRFKEPDGRKYNFHLWWTGDGWEIETEKERPEIEIEVID